MTLEEIHATLMKAQDMVLKMMSLRDERFGQLKNATTEQKAAIRTALTSEYAAIKSDLQTIAGFTSLDDIDWTKP